MKKRVLSLLLTLCMVCSLLPSVALAATYGGTCAADALYELGLFSGTGIDENGKPIYDLDRAPTRQEATVMLVRLLGKVEEATNGSWTMPFTDVADWAKPYVGYAYTNGLAFGVSETAFGSGDIVSASQYLTFVLRALGYESGTDFQWDKAWELSDKIGITSGQYNSTSNFLRGDVAICSYNSLFITMKNSNTTLMASLQSQSQYTNEHLQGIWLNYRDTNDYISEYMFDGTNYICGNLVTKITHTGNQRKPFNKTLSIDGNDYNIVSFDISSGTYEIRDGKLIMSETSSVSYDPFDGVLVSKDTSEVSTRNLAFVNSEEVLVSTFKYNKRSDSIIISAIQTWVKNASPVTLTPSDIEIIIYYFNRMLDNETPGAKAFLAANESYLDGIAARAGGKSSSSYEYQENRYFQNAMTYYSQAKKEVESMKTFAHNDKNIVSKCDELIANFDSVLTLTDARSVESMQILLDVTTANMAIENEIVDILESYS